MKKFLSKWPFKCYAATLVVGNLLTVTVIAVMPIRDNTADSLVWELQKSPVSISEGAYGTSLTSVATITKHIGPTDPILVVMLNDWNENSQLKTARQINERSGQNKIVVVSKYDGIAVNSSLLPKDAINDILKDRIVRSDRSRSGIEEEDVVRVVDKLHAYLMTNGPVRHPYTSYHPSFKVKALHMGPIWITIMFAFWLLMASLSVGLAYDSIIEARIEKERDRTGKSYSEIELPKKTPPIPRHIRKLLDEVRDKAALMKDAKSRSALMTACTDTETLFGRLRDNKNRQDKRLAVEACIYHLTNLSGILDGYLQIQANPSHWDQPAELAAMSRESIASFAAGSVDANRRLTAKQEFELRVSTAIMNLSQFSNPPAIAAESPQDTVPSMASEKA